MQKLQNSANLICGGLLLFLFVYMCISSYKDYKQQKEIPKRLEKLEKEIKEISRKIKEKYEEPLPYQPIIKKKEIPKSLYTIAEIPISQEWDELLCTTGVFCID